MQPVPKGEFVRPAEYWEHVRQVLARGSWILPSVQLEQLVLEPMQLPQVWSQAEE